MSCCRVVSTVAPPRSRAACCTRPPRTVTATWWFGSSDVEIWDASGLGVLVGANRKARQCGRRLVLADVPPRQLRLLRATRLSRALTVEPLAS